MDAWQIVAEPRRREILRLVWDHELSAGDIADRFEITFGAVSQHLGVLREAGYVSVRRAGNHRYYRTDKAGLGPLRPALELMWTQTLDNLADAVETEAVGAGAVVAGADRAEAVGVDAVEAGAVEREAVGDAVGDEASGVDVSEAGAPEHTDDR